MKTITQTPTRIIGLLLLAGMVGFIMMLLGVTSGDKQRCSIGSSDFSISKLI